MLLPLGWRGQCTHSVCGAEKMCLRNSVTSIINHTLSNYLKIAWKSVLQIKNYLKRNVGIHLQFSCSVPGDSYFTVLAQGMSATICFLMKVNRDNVFRVLAVLSIIVLPFKQFSRLTKPDFFLAT